MLDINKKKLPIGSSNFKEIIEKDYYFVDKSLLLKEIIDLGAKVTIIPRPRRFGKTLNLNMIRTFFENPKKNNFNHFKHLKIWQAGEEYQKECGKYPVIYLSFKDSKDRSWENCYEGIVSLISSPSISGLVKKILHRLKFLQDKKLSRDFLKPLLQQNFYKEYDIVIPLPCHWLRVLKRKFNHLHFLFSFVSNLDHSVVKRLKYTKKFYKLNKQERQKTIIGVYKILDPSKIKGKRILVIDDIYTTGTSFNELHKMLNKYKPLCVDGFFICKV